ncbi:MAG: NAD-dependent epimerase/dehydratase family protein [candidate division WOR-3 bacterium]
MNILVTGSNGFLGKNLISFLKQDKNLKIYSFDIENSFDELENILKNNVELIFHLAGVNRPKTNDEFYKGNSDFTKTLVDLVLKYSKNIPIVFSSSIQVELDNDYGKSKKLAEDVLIDYAKKSGAKVYIYRLQNLFGKWGKPNYNSVIATFCYNISRNFPIQISNRENIVKLLYIDDVVKEFYSIVKGEKKYNGYFYNIEKVFEKNLGEIVDLLYKFKNSRDDLTIFDFKDEFTKHLYETYISYLPIENFSYKLKSNEDERGSLSEILKSDNFGQIFISYTKPGITRGNHYHQSKTEKFLVIKGEAIIKFRNIITNEKVEYKVSGNDLQVVDIPPGYTHSITNIGKGELITLFWSIEKFDKSNPDTFYEEV